MSRALQLLHARSRERLDALLEKVDGPANREPTSSPTAAVPTQVRDLLSAHQRWLFNERFDLHATIDIAKAEDQAKLIHWWVHYMPGEYGAQVDEADWEHLAGPADADDDGPFVGLINRLMVKNYLLKKKVRAKHDLTTRYGRADFLDWYLRQGIFLDPIEGSFYLERLLERLSELALPSESSLPVNRFAAIVLKRYRKDFADDVGQFLVRDGARHGTLRREDPRRAQPHHG